MLDILRKAVTKKDFYKEGFKKVSRGKVISFLLFICFLYSLLVTPIFVYTNLVGFENIKTEIQNIPPKFEIKYNKENGLTTNTSTPYIFNLTENTTLVIDPDSNYKSKNLNKEEIVLRNKGMVLYQKGKLIDQNSYGNLPFLEFKITGEELNREVRNINIQFLALMSAIFGFLINFLSASINIFWISIIFGTIAYLMGRFILKIELTFLQTTKKILFLGPFILLGMAINVISFGAVPIADMILLAIGYLYLNR